MADPLLDQDVPDAPVVPKSNLPPSMRKAAAPPIQEAPAPKKEKPMSVTGFAENALDDAWDFAKGLYNIIPSTIKSYQQNVPQIVKGAKDLSPSMLWNWNDKEGEFKGAIPETLKGVIDAVKQPYQEHGARVLYEKPFTVAADAITLITVGGTQIKNIGRIAEASGAGEKAERLIRAGQYLEDLPSKLTRGAVDKGVQMATGHDLAKERQFLHLKQEERGAEMLKLQDVAKDSLPAIDALNPEEQALFHKARVGGGTAYGVTDEVLAQNPKVKAALEAYAPLEKYSGDVYLGRGHLNQATMDEVLAKKFALENFGDVSKANIAKAAEIIEEARQTGKRLPMYGPNVFEGKGKVFSVDDALHDMMTGGKNMREGKVGSLEEMKGAKGYSTDPRVYTRQMVKSAADVEAKGRMMDRLLQEKTLIGGGKEGFKAGESIPEGIHRKYYEDPIRAQALQNITDPTIKRLLKWEYTGKSSAMWQMYDKFFSLFAKQATRWNPKWVPGNIVGDAFLGALFGADWDAARVAIKNRNMPSQFLSGKTGHYAQDALEKKGIINGTLDRYGDIAGQIDQATRAGILIKSTADKLKNFAANHEAFAQSIEEVLSSTQKFSDVQVGLQRIEENVARRSPDAINRTKELIKLGEQERKLDAAIQARRGTVLTSSQREATLTNAREAAKASVGERLAEARGKLDRLTSPERIEMIRNAKGAEAAQAFGTKAAEAKAKVRRLESYYNTIAAESPEIVRMAVKKVGKFNPAGMAAEMDEALSKIPGYSRTRAAEISKDIRGQVRDSVYRKHLAEYQQSLDAAKAEILATAKSRLESEILKTTKSFESNVDAGRAASSGATNWLSNSPKEKVNTRELDSATRALESLKSANGTYAAKKAGAFGSTEAKISDLRGLEAARDTVRQKIVNLTKERDMIVRDIMDDLIKQGELDKHVPGLRQQVDIVREGVDRANAVLPSYLNLNGFEQKVMGRIIPFYPFVKTMNMLAFRAPLLAPAKTFMWNRLQNFLMTQVNDPRLPEDFRGRLPLALLEDGRTVWFKATTYSPVDQLKTSQIGGIPIPGMLDPLRNPVIALGYKFMGGKTIFDAGTIPYGTEAVLAGDGTRVRFKDNGMLEKEMNQTPLVSGLMHLFPSVQLATTVLTPYWTNKFDWAGMPEPILKPDGSYKYPKELMDRISNLVGANVQTRSKEDIIKQERIKAQQTIKEYMKTYKKADPDERELIREALQDYQKGLYRHFDR